MYDFPSLRDVYTIWDSMIFSLHIWTRSNLGLHILRDEFSIGRTHEMVSIQLGEMIVVSFEKVTNRTTFQPIFKYLHLTDVTDENIANIKNAKTTITQPPIRTQL